MRFATEPLPAALCSKPGPVEAGAELDLIGSQTLKDKHLLSLKD